MHILPSKMTKMGNFEFSVMFEKFSSKNTVYNMQFISIMTLITWMALIASERFRLPLMTKIILLIEIIYLKLKFNLESAQCASVKKVRFRAPTVKRCQIEIFKMSNSCSKKSIFAEKFLGRKCNFWTENVNFRSKTTILESKMQFFELKCTFQI